MDETRHLASWVGGQEALHDRVLTLDEALAAVESVGTEEVHRLAGELFRDDRLAPRRGGARRATCAASTRACGCRHDDAAARQAPQLGARPRAATAAQGSGARGCRCDDDLRGPTPSLRPTPRAPRPTRTRPGSVAPLRIGRLARVAPPDGLAAPGAGRAGAPGDRGRARRPEPRRSRRGPMADRRSRSEPARPRQPTLPPTARRRSPASLPPRPRPPPGGPARRVPMSSPSGSRRPTELDRLFAGMPRRAVWPTAPEAARRHGRRSAARSRPAVPTPGPIRACGRSIRRRGPDPATARAATGGPAGGTAADPTRLLEAGRADVRHGDPESPRGGSRPTRPRAPDGPDPRAAHPGRARSAPRAGGPRPAGRRLPDPRPGCLEAEAAYAAAATALGDSTPRASS